MIDDTRMIRLLVDTGASMTTVSPGILRALGYRVNGKEAVFNTANGQVRASVVTLESLSLGAGRVVSLDVGALALSGTPVDGLLGMNFLREFEFSLDQVDSKLILR